LHVWPDGRESLTFSNDWPLLSPPVPGEPLAAYWDRVIVGDPFVQTLLAQGATIRRGLKPPSLNGMRPADRTLEWWRKRWPYKEFHSSNNQTRREALAYHLDRIVWRLMVELFDRLQVVDLVMKGHRVDLSASPLEMVEPSLLRNPLMVWRPRAPGGGGFRPEQQGSSLPPSLPWYCELILDAPDPKPPPRQTGLDFRPNDDVLADEIVKGVDARQYQSDWDACLALAHRAEGKGNLESKQKRLSVRVRLHRARNRLSSDQD
jgi:hypothetical protein